MVRSRIFITIGILLISLCLFLAFSSYKQKSIYDKEMAAQTTVFFLNSLSKGDSKSALKHVWPDEQLHVQSPERIRVFKGSKILEVIKIDYDSAKYKPEYYQQFYKIISIMIRLKIVHTDDAGNPPGNYIFFINVVQKNPGSNWLITELGSGP
ncbi:hypothetical protein BEN74_01480 [Acinetobacter sp. WCHAc010034]|uniref:hypothetical protein n=1 Tax=Acinetobacter sp. WCHAc010034 TaxID=1879049 RepID=UPI00083B138E|nr:hypothetical protein [Acinetobacter sp. WCHAc010034]AYA01684.1 hypothetical protein BEN74_01480 [Acinetobacter sp. WCHAc010034]